MSVFESHCLFDIHDTVERTAVLLKQTHRRRSELVIVNERYRCSGLSRRAPTPALWLTRGLSFIGTLSSHALKRSVQYNLVCEMR
jgi:hypothetical protein